MNAKIVIFAKAPVAGRVKTRLIPVLGEAGAATLACAMLRDTVAQAIAAGLGVPELCASPAPGSDDWRGLLPSGVDATDQGDGDLGERLSRAAARGVAGGAPVLLIGTDCPDLNAERLRDAAAMLETHDAVIMPATDGGYVLLGLARYDPSLFAGIAWSTDTVARDTIARVEALGWSLHMGETLRDIDEPGDLARRSERHG